MLRRLSLVLLAVWATSAWAQSVISAHSGVIHYVEGKATLDGKGVQPKFGEFPDVKPGQTLAVEGAPTEVLLTPGVFLRLDENSSFRMVSNKLDDTRVEIVSGSALIEVGELLQDNAITVLLHDAQIALLKKGLYRFDADPARLRVYDGEARVTSGSETIVAKKGREVEFGGVLSARNFDTKETDAFYRWSSRRAEYLAQANISAAKAAGGMGYTNSNWAWNPWYGMFTFIPMSGMYYSPFGWYFYSPRAVYYYVYAPAYSYGGGGAGRGASREHEPQTV